MPIDTSIITRGMNRVELEPRSNALARLLQVQGAQQQQEMNALKMDEYRRGLEDQSQLRSALSAPGADPYNVLLQRGNVKEATEFAKGKADLKKSDVETENRKQDTKIKQYTYLANVLKDVKDQTGYQTAYQLAEAFGMDMNGIPTAYDPRFVETARGAFTTEVQKWTDQRAREQMAETARHNLRTEGLTAQGQRITMRGQDLTDTRARDLNAITKDAAADAKKVGAIDKGVTALANTLQKEGIPELETAVSGAEGALGRYKPGTVPGVGPLKNVLPAFAMSAEGKDVRQALAQVRNIVLSARSGAAVTDQELRRLVEEIGTGAGMSEDDLRKGLAKVRARIDSIKTNAAAGVNEDVLRTYQERGGIPIKRGGGAATSGSNIDALLNKYK